MAGGQYGVSQFMTDEQKKRTRLGAWQRGDEYDPVVMGDWQVKPEAVSPEKAQSDRIYKQDVLNARTQFGLSNAPYQERKKQYDEDLALAQRKRQFGNYGFVTAPEAQEATVAPPPVQRTTTGGGQAIAAENPDQQPAGNPQAPGGVPWLKSAVPAEGADAQWNVASRGRDGQPDIQTATVGDTQYWQMEGGVASKKLNQQPRAAAGQSRPGLGLNGMRDLGNGQVAVGQVDGFQNPGYGFKGSREDAARFFQPVGRPGGYNPYKQRFRTLFDEQMDARRAAQNAPSPAEPQGPMGWKRLRDKMNNESRERIAEMTGGFGLTQAGMQDARAREQLAQQYGINMAQLGNDDMRTRAALGLNALQQQQAMQQLAQARMLDEANQTYATARPGSQEWIRARNIRQAYGQDGKLNYEKVKVPGADGLEREELRVINPDGTYSVMQAAGAGGQSGDRFTLDREQIGKALATKEGQKAAKEGKIAEYLAGLEEQARQRAQ